MPGIFLSHSSSDKPFVRKLAADLVAHEIPVWFDEWELELGQELTRRVFESLDESSLMVILLSPTSVRSPWVRRELVGALAKEKSLGAGRQFMVPLLIGDCVVPSEIADRLLIDFRQSYHDSIDRLIGFLRSKGAHKIDVPIGKQLVPLIVSDFVNLNEVLLQRRVKYLMERYDKDMEVHEHQLVFAGDEEYASLRLQLLGLKERVESQKSHEQRMRVYETWEVVSRIERGLSDGLITIINGMVKPRALGNWDWVGESCHRFFRAVRAGLARRLILDMGTNLNSPVLAELRHVPDHPFYNEEGAASFFGVPEVSPYVVTDTRTNEYFKMFVPTDSYIGRHVPRQGTEWLHNAFSQGEWARYAVPQMVYWKVFSPPSLVIWSPSNALIGVA
jgi:hypothetical protein